MNAAGVCGSVTAAGEQQAVGFAEGGIARAWRVCVRVHVCMCVLGLGLGLGLGLRLR